MNRVSISSTARSKQRDETGRLQGRWLVFVRIVWLLVAALAVGLFGAGLPFYFAHLQIPCVGADACAVNGALSLANMRTLQGLGISVSSYSVYLLVCSIVAALVWMLTGGLIFWHKSNDWVLLLVALMLATFGAVGTGGPRQYLPCATQSGISPSMVSISSQSSLRASLPISFLPDGSNRAGHGGQQSSISCCRLPLFLPLLSAMMRLPG